MENASNSSLAVWNVPSRRNPFFMGREEVLTHLHTMLHSGKAAALTSAQAISGLGGIGKTQTAVEYAYRHRDEYQAVLWCRAETRRTLLADFVTIADLLDLPEKREQDQGWVIQAVKLWLQTHKGWLLILDNIEDLALLEDFLPTKSEGHLVLTTRTQVTGPFAQRIDLEQMKLEEGALFLLRRAKLIGPEDCLEEISDTLRVEAREISQMLDGLPLALDQVGAYIEEVGCGLSDYLDRYQTQRAALLNRRGNLIADHPESVSATFSLSFEKVEQANPAAADLLRLCAFLDPDAIPEEIITEGSSELSSILQPIASNPVALDETFATLRHYSLLHRNPATRTLTIHRLAQAVLKEGMDEETQRWWAERTVCAVNRAFPDGCEFVTWHCCQRCLPHAQACATLIDQWKMAFAEAGRLLNQAGTYLWKRAQYAQAEVLLCQARDIRMQVWEPTHLAMAESLNILAVLYWDQGRYTEAEPLLQQALTIREQQLEPEHADVAQSLNNLALLYFEQGRYTKAESLYLRALATRGQQLELEHPDTFQSLNGLAMLYEGTSATATQADQFAHSLLGLAELYLEQSRCTEAESLLRRALAIWEQHLGPQHPHTAFALHALAAVYSALGRYTEAELLFRRAVNIREQQLGPE
ncbi:MAG: tetratricopeptide repeat protein, partial [Chloroflexota bacterium]|nr:tetratricopeptide repeat protein [Chloroflexota bacterium]